MESETRTPEESLKTRKKKLLADPERMWASCKVCQEPGNLENMIWQKIPLKDKDGQVIWGAFEGMYFCSENCQGLFSS
jgi:hypothetical protein